MMRIWLINHYAVPPQYYPLARPSLFAKRLIDLGHDVIIIAASTVHNSDSKNIITNKERFIQIIDDGIPYVLINCVPYKGNGVKRVINIIEFALKLSKVLDTLVKPDAIVATSFDPISCFTGIKYAKKHGIKAVAEIADLWPETLVAYTGISKNNPIVRCLRRIEKQIYLNADRIVFTMEGAYDYIKEQNWEQDIPYGKVRFINNGIDLEQFDYNKEHYQIDDSDLRNPDIFKIIYTGSIRRVNNLGVLIETAKCITNDRIVFLIWGDGDELEHLKKTASEEGVNNIIFKGKVDKKYIPYITSCADINILHNTESPIMRFGLSLNKMFEYLAAGRPIIVDFKGRYNPAVRGGAVETRTNKQSDICEAINYIFQLSGEQKQSLCNAARKTAEEYSFIELTNKLLDVLAFE